MLAEENGASNVQMDCSELYMDMDITLSRSTLPLYDNMSKKNF